MIIETEISNSISDLQDLYKLTDFVHNILSLMHEECGTEIMAQTFGGEIRETTKCIQCDNEYSTDISFEYLSMPSNIVQVKSLSNRIPFIIHIFNDTLKPKKHVFYVPKHCTLVDVSWSIFKQCMSQYLAHFEFLVSVHSCSQILIYILVFSCIATLHNQMGWIISIVFVIIRSLIIA